MAEMATMMIMDAYNVAPERPFYLNIGDEQLYGHVRELYDQNGAIDWNNLVNGGETGITKFLVRCISRNNMTLEDSLPYVLECFKIHPCIVSLVIEDFGTDDFLNIDRNANLVQILNHFNNSQTDKVEYWIECLSDMWIDDNLMVKGG